MEPPLTLLTSADIGVRRFDVEGRLLSICCDWKGGIFREVPSRSGSFFHFVCSALEFWEAWHVAVVHRFHCRPDASQGNEHVSLAVWLRLRHWPRVSIWRFLRLVSSPQFSSRASF